MTSELKYRYPGLRPFGIDDKNVFFGRDTEARELTDLIRAERTAILFSKSGLGKSSLLNAKVCPQLITNGFWPILIRLQPPTEKDQTLGPVDVVVDRLRAEFDAAYQHLAEQVNGWRKEVKTLSELASSSSETASATSPQTPPDDRLSRLQSAIQAAERQLEKAVLEDNKFVPAKPILYNAECPRLWEYVKIHRLPNDVVPIFVFDQFEQFFAFSLNAREEFARQLSELIHDQPPTRIMDWLLDIPRSERQLDTIEWGKQPLVKCLLAIRSDRLFEVDSLKPYIPLIFRNRYKLNPLKEEQARDAVDKPAQAEGDFRTPKFSFSPGVRERIIRDLANDDCEIESSQLQIVCNHFENHLVEQYADKHSATDAPIIIDQIDNSNSIKRILIKFYRNQLRSIGTPEEVELARNVLENELVVNHQRVGLAEFKMKDLLQGRTDIIKKLEEARLIRAEETHLGKTYELSHDTLIEPVESVSQLLNSLRQRDNREKERIRERKEQLERQKKAEAERQKLLAEQRRLEQERQEKENQLAEEQRQKRKLAWLTLGLLIIGIIAIVLYVNNQSLLNKNELLRSKAKNDLDYANNVWAQDAYTAGNQRLAYRFWASSDSIKQKVIEPKRLMAAFSGASSQTDPTDTNLTYVANLYNDYSFEVWRHADTTYEKLDIPNPKLASSLQLRNGNLIVIERDSLLQVIDLKTPRFRKKRFVKNAANTVPGRSDTVHYAIQTFLPPKGGWLTTLDGNHQAHLFKIETKNLILNKQFESLSERIQTISLDSLKFSDSEKFLLVKHSGVNQYELFDLRADRPPVPLKNTSYATFSPSGKYLLTLHTNGLLSVTNVETGEPRASMVLPNPRVRIADLAVNKDESALLVITKRQAPAQAQNKVLYDLFSIRDAQPKPVLKSIAQNMSRYQLFRGLGRVVFFNNPSDSARVYSMATGSTQTLPLPPGALVKAGSTCMIYVVESDKKQLYLYDLVSGRKTDVSQLMSDKEHRFAFYAPPIPSVRADEKLIRATPTELTLFDIKRLQRSGDRKPDTTFITAGNPDQIVFIPTTLSISGQLIRVKSQDEVVLCFFADNQKNRLDYLSRYIYPRLTKIDSIAAGL